MKNIFGKKNLTKFEKTLIKAYVKYAIDENSTDCRNAQELAKAISELTGNYNMEFYSNVVIYILLSGIID
jgi:hypothetical protein